MTSDKINSSGYSAMVPLWMPEAVKIQGWYPESNLIRLWEMAKNNNLGASPILEVGTWRGRSAYALAMAARARGTYLVCVDTWKGVTQGDNRWYEEAEKLDILAECKKNLESTFATVVYLQGTSVDILPLLEPAKFSLVHIDGDHTYPTVDRDVMEGWRLVQPGGVLCGDDYDMKEVRHAVSRLHPYTHVFNYRLWSLYKPLP